MAEKMKGILLASKGEFAGQEKLDFEEEIKQILGEDITLTYSYLQRVYLEGEKNSIETQFPKADAGGITLSIPSGLSEYVRWAETVEFFHPSEQFL